jgi:GT2 family glycosyltransferase
MTFSDVAIVESHMSLGSSPVSPPPLAAARPHVYILLLNWNGWRHTAECLESLFQLTYPSFTVIVCDNGSTDDSLTRLRSWLEGRTCAEIVGSPLEQPHRPLQAAIPYVEIDARAAERVPLDTAVPQGARVILIGIGENRGFAGGNNVGLRFLLARQLDGYVWLLNNDMVVAPDALDRLVELAASDPAMAAVGATLLEYASPAVIQEAGGWGFVPWQGLPRAHSATGKPRGSHEGSHPNRLDYITMGCLLAPLDAVRRVGLIDERFFMYGEDIDYSLRLKSAGYRIGFAPDAEVWHKGSASAVAGSATHDYNLVRSALLLVEKFYPHLLPVTCGYLLYRCVLPKAVRGQWHRLAVVARAFRDFAQARRVPLSAEATSARAAAP